MPANPVHLAEEVFRLAGELNAAVRNAHDAGISVALDARPSTMTLTGADSLLWEPVPSLQVDLVLTTQTTHLRTPAEPASKPVPEETWAIGSNETSVRWPVIVDKATGDDICEISQTYDLDANLQDPERMEAMRLANMIAAAPKMLKALLLSEEHEALPADRGGAHGPKGLARARFVTARRYAIDLAFGKVKP